MKIAAIFCILTALCVFSELGLAQQKDTLYVDDMGPGYLESGVAWQNGTDRFGTPHAAFGPTSRQQLLDIIVEGSARFTPTVTTAGFYVAYFIIPKTGEGRNQALYVVNTGVGVPDSMRINQNENSGNWIFLGIYYFPAGQTGYVEAINDSVSTFGYKFKADAVRLVSTPAEKDIEPVRRNEYNFAEVNIGEYKDWMLRVYNIGGTKLTINNVEMPSAVFSVQSPEFPLEIDPHQYIDVAVRFAPTFERIYEDNIIITSDDSDEPVIQIPVKGEGTAITVIVNNDDGFPYYMEHVGEWVNSNGAAVVEGITNAFSRYSVQSTNPGARAEFIPDIPTSGLYNIYYCGPATTNASNHALFEVHPFGAAVDSVWIDQNSGDRPDWWKYIGTYYLFQGMVNSVHIVNDGTGVGYVLRTDLMKFTTVSSVADINVPAFSHEFPEVKVGTSAEWQCKIFNLGNFDLSVTGITTQTAIFDVASPTSYPIIVQPLDSLICRVSFSPQSITTYKDTLKISSDDLDEPVVNVLLSGIGVGEQVVVDNSDSLYCTTGPTDTTWNYSASTSGVKQNSLYTYLLFHPGAWVKWVPEVPKTGQYDLYVSCVPTSNSSAQAPYVVQPVGVAPDTQLVNQNTTTSGNIWIKVGTYTFLEGSLNYIELVNDTSKSNMDKDFMPALPGDSLVLRADAIKITEPGDPTAVDMAFAVETSPRTYELHQNYPNPFNPETRIEFDLPRDCEVHLRIFNTLGQRVYTLVDKKMRAGSHSITWDGRDDSGIKLSSGIYFIRMDSGEFTKNRKMLLIK